MIERDFKSELEREREVVVLQPFLTIFINRVEGDQSKEEVVEPISQTKLLRGSTSYSRWVLSFILLFVSLYYCNREKIT